MNNDVEVEGRPRPLSTGLWTLFSWLRRDDRSVSSESLSSAGSDRTVASFAFLAPAHYQTATGPLVLPPPGPPTDSYKKRVYDRNLRRHHDRDLTLHRKYGLYKSEATCSYDAFSLPPVRRINGESGNRWTRERRATSECYQRRLAHVPGKRRAPLPPVSLSSAGPSASLTHRNTRKRPAPQPPVRLIEKTEENLKSAVVNHVVVQMSSNSYHDKPKLNNNGVTMGCKSEKYSKKDSSSKDPKIKPEKGFLKQIFENKKKNSSIDTSTVKILPSISELDKQAAEIIETCKLKASEQNNNLIFEKTTTQGSSQAECWFCIHCLRKYNSSVVACVYCLPNQKEQSFERVQNERGAISKGSNSSTQTDKDLHQHVLSNKNNGAQEKQKLKEMLKEMKDSLPKRPKHDFNKKIEAKVTVTPESFKRNSDSSETPTLRVGSTPQEEKKTYSISKQSTSNIVSKSIPETISSIPKPCSTSAKTTLAAQVISAYKKNDNNKINLAGQLANNNDHDAQAPIAGVLVVVKSPESVTHKETILRFKDKNALNTPLKISSLLNPMYVPKNPILDKPQLTKLIQPESKNENTKTKEVNTNKVNRILQTTSVPTSCTDAASSMSQTGVPANIAIIDNKYKIDLEKCTKGEQISLQNVKPQLILKQYKTVLESNPKEYISLVTSPAKQQNSNKLSETQDQHSRRRDLINQLEKSIAKGDERAAAEAAAKLAQLRLSCSVLSFSSQILSQPSTFSASNVQIKGDKIEPNIMISTTNIEPHQEVQKEPQAVKSAKERSPTKVLISKLVPNAILTPNREETTSQMSKAVLPKVITLERNHDAKKQTKVQEAIKESPNRNDDNMITIAVLVEDREATRGPVHLRINRQALMRDLRREAETSLGVATNLQRWIVGRALCVNDNTPIISLAGSDFSAPFYLCVVESDTKVGSVLLQQTKSAVSYDTNNLQNNIGNVYTELVQLEQQALVPNAENFECGVCTEEYPPGNGVVLRECVHIFCKDCLSEVVRHCEEPDVPCPAMGCRGILQEREIRALVPPQDYERWLTRGLAAAESGTKNAFHCRTRDCKGWALCEPGVQRFPCPVCKCINCVPCQAIHDGETCEQHHAKLKQTPGKSNNEADDGTRTLLNSLISKGEALECPECSAIITKKWGCDWVKCSACKTEICWVTRGRRWGPGGKGDTSGGCRCGVDGKRCHPACGYCH